MKRIIEDHDSNGFDILLGEQVIVLCVNYIYTGKLTGNNTDTIELTTPSIVYETGEWSTKTYKDSQRLHCDILNIQKSAIESFGKSK
jgi:hypothetical protein